MGTVYSVGPNEVMVISGGPGCLGGNRTKKFIIGGWGWAWSCVTNVQRMSLQVHTINPKCEDVLTIEGVGLYVTGVAQIKVMKDPEFLHKAVEQFLGKDMQIVASKVLQTMEGHLRAILGSMTVEEVYRDRRKLSENVREVAAPDVSRMGIEIVSFVVKDIYDKVDYLKSLGKPQTANVKRDAAVGKAEAHRDAGIREAECDKEKMDRIYLAQTEIADFKRDHLVHVNTFNIEVNTKTAETNLAYELEKNKVTQLLRCEEVKIDLMERRKMIDVEEMEILRKEKELGATVKMPAEAEAYRIQKLADAYRIKTILAAEGSADKVRMVGQAEATRIEAVGKAEAEKMRLKAHAYSQYEDAAKIYLILQALPKIANEVAAPLAQIDQIVMVGDDKTTTEVSKLVSQLPPAIQALTGVNLTGVLGAIPGATMG